MIFNILDVYFSLFYFYTPLLQIFKIFLSKFHKKSFFIKNINYLGGIKFKILLLLSMKNSYFKLIKESSYRTYTDYVLYSFL